MRWAFPRFLSESELRSQAVILEAIDAWWQEFSARASELPPDMASLPTWLASALARMDAQLDCIIRQPGAIESGHLVLSSKGKANLLPLVRVVLGRAPAVPRWRFGGYRPPMDMAVADHSLAQLAGPPLAEWEASVVATDEHLIDVAFRAPRSNALRALDTGTWAILACEQLLGEEALMHWIGSIEVERRPPWWRRGSRSQRTWFPASELPELVRQQIDRIEQTLPAAPIHIGGTPELGAKDKDGRQKVGAVFKLKPDHGRDDYPARTDMMVASATWPAHWLATVSPQPFSSRRFSRCGETFAYLKIDGRNGFDNQPWPDRATLEQELDDALGEAKLGCVLSGGTGLIYSYIDFALTDVEKAFDVIAEIARRGRLDLRSWLMFFDAEYADEWLGIYPDTPPPPSM